ncbi:unnamed protein product [Rotaria sordida]|uniref:Uncharacterized protein n=1 Tax=Rotaria sordida TaxID=392033 RepID=A0A814VXR0_9BILA|nr:unnamed protein product [Rotaria sordida]CAF3580845.1 unnamed protein product [Rotaria sordida]CAF3681749.1 unnamed protein product [Rotaria sordida]
MALVPVNTRNRINPISIPALEPSRVPYATYHQVELCADPNCPVCRAQRRDQHYKHHKRRHHHHHHHKKHRTNFWNTLLPRVESASSTVTIHSIELDERRPHYNSYTNERAVVPVNQAERQVVTTTTRPRRIADDDIVREAWVNNPTRDDEIVCCRAYDGCRCPCWCCIILIIIFVILIIILIVLLATLL